MTPDESDRLAALLRAAASGGTTVALVEHDVPFVVRIADRLTVLDAGRILADGRPDDVRARPEVRQAYLGVDV
jgi:branched-chain amino acid transport system ATP-binding protein